MSNNKVFSELHFPFAVNTPKGRVLTKLDYNGFPSYAKAEYEVRRKLLSVFGPKQYPEIRKTQHGFFLGSRCVGKVETVNVG
jgi:hypothetical protein